MDDAQIRDDPEELRFQAALLRERQGLGRSPALSALFDYLETTSLEGRAPKEIEVADAVFANGREFDTLQDASVRVHASRLRKKLDEFYAGKGADQPSRLILLKGQYRLAVISQEAVAQAADPAAAYPSSQRRPIAIAVIATFLVCVALGALLWSTLWRPDPLERALAEARGSGLWSAIVRDDKPITVVVGDYYIFGELDDHGEVLRLVRDFRISSRHDLDKLAMERPALASRYRDLGLRYYPIGIASAIRDVMPVLRTGERGVLPVQIIPASALTPAMLRNRNIVYIGYFSALGALRDPLFTISHFAIGASYDDIVDKKSGTVFAAGGGAPGSTQDFGYVATFAGPNHNRIVIIAGARDSALMQAADYAWQAPVLRELDERADHASSFEALWRVDTLDGENLAGRLLAARPIDDRAAWRGGAPQAFPDDATPSLPEPGE
jgi:hypothetical protein